MDSGGGAVAISRTEQGAKAWCRTCCYWFCGSNGAGRGGGDSIGGSGFWAIIERKIWSVYWVNVRASSLASQLPQVFVSFTMLGTPQNIVGAGLPAMGPVQTPQLSQTQQKAHQSVGFLFLPDDDQNNLIFGASSFTGSFCAVCAFQPPPRALYRLTALVSCARRSVISACCALNS
ncbi:hypothetical protein PMI37_01829 [Pseudomonas sp. GM80]|nr:hypothetical protein PMI37_01829 [Pseudomonas sp. GM80]